MHFQWLPVQHLDGHLLPARRTASRRAPRPLVLTAHDILPREPRPGQLAAQRRLYERFDAIVVHSEHGRERLIGELGVDPVRVHVIPHGVLRALVASGAGTAVSRRRWQTDRPVVLFFGLMRPYKGLDVLLEAWRGIEDAELWIVGMPAWTSLPLRESPLRRRAVPDARFVSDEELRRAMRRAELVVLPYREIDQSGVAFTALGAGVPLLLSDVGGFPELAATGAARTFPAGDAPRCATALRELLAIPARSRAMAERAPRRRGGPVRLG